MPTTTNHDYNTPTEDTFDWGDLLNQNFETMDESVPLQGSLSNRPSANGSRPPYFVTSPDTDQGVYCDVDGAWVKIA